jgi:hypothetical protein
MFNYFSNLLVFASAETIEAPSDCVLDLTAEEIYFLNGHPVMKIANEMVVNSTIKAVIKVACFAKVNHRNIALFNIYY